MRGASELSASLSKMEDLSYGRNEQILDTDLFVRDSKRSKNHKTKKIGWPKWTVPEHIVYGDDWLKIWL